jgi:hypothetical protein
MKHLLCILLLATLCATTSFGQTIKTLGFNTTNGEVVANTTNTLTFTNAGVAFGGDMTISGPVIAGSGVSFSFEDADFAYGASIVRQNLGFSTNLNTFWTATNSSNARSAVGLGATWLTNTNVTNFRTAIGLGATNDVTFETVNVDQLSWEGNLVFEPETGIFWTDIGFENPTNAAITRTNVGLPLPALTNTSNVTMMRALAGSTNTNQPYSGIITYKDDVDDINTLTVSNGIIIQLN